MKHEVLMEMSKSELDEYGQVLGIDVTGKSTIAKKVALIESKRERVAEIEALGMTVTIPIKRLHDKRVSDLVAINPMTDDNATKLLHLLLGDEQMQTLNDRATDEDGTVDVDALGIVMARILSSDELKNF